MPILLTKYEQGVASLTLNRPEKRNALSLELLQLLDQELEKCEQEDSVRVIVLSANGPVFSSGHDLKEMEGAAKDDFALLFSTCSQVMMKIRSLTKPVIAVVEGMATAAGCQLVAACDMAIATAEARFATPGVKIGLFCSTPMVPLVRAVPAKTAMEMLLTGTPISAERALTAGLINHIAPQEEISGCVEQWCQAIINSSPAVIALGKQAFYQQLSLPEPEAYQQATDLMVTNSQFADAKEGINAFLQKRAPEWKGE